LYAGVIALLIIAALLSYRWLRVRNRLKEQEKEKQIDRLTHHALRSKFIPHFTGNVLNSINYLITKDAELAQKYIVDFADFSRQTLLNSDKLCWSLAEELSFTESYLSLEKLRFEEKLNYSITVAPDVDTQKMLPAMILQTFCENALKHGLKNKQGAGTIKVSVYMQDNFGVFAVEDDGIGREKAKVLHTEGTQEGLKIIRQQLELFNRENAEKARLHIEDLVNDAGEAVGTRFELHIPQGYVMV
jgi:sensor histidine kinase YesM